MKLTASIALWIIKFVDIDRRKDAKRMNATVAITIFAIFNIGQHSIDS